MNLIIAVDPGISGAVVAYFPAAHKFLVWRDFKTIHDIVQAINLAVHEANIRLLKASDISGVIEFVASRPGQGVCSVFTFGRAAGAAFGSLEALGIRGSAPGAQGLDEVTPQRWQNWVKKFVGRRPAADEMIVQSIYSPDFQNFDSRVFAATIFPDEIHLFSRAKDHNTADALLIAVYQAWHDRELALQRYLTDLWAFLTGQRSTPPSPPESFGDSPSDRDTPAPEQLPRSTLPQSDVSGSKKTS